MTRRLLIPTIAVALGLLLAGCGHQSSRADASAPQSATKDPNAEHVKLVGNDMLKFDPMTLKAKAGHIVVDFHDQGSYPHNVRFPALHKVSGSTTGGITGNDVTLDLGTLKAGTYAFICDFHDGAGMKGTLVLS